MTADPLGTFPYHCSRCGVRCETVAELADPDHHDFAYGQ